MKIVRAVDHVSQKSIYFHDPDGNLLEIYNEVPKAREMFLQGRHDRDVPLSSSDRRRAGTESGYTGPRHELQRVV